MQMAVGRKSLRLPLNFVVNLKLLPLPKKLGLFKKKKCLTFSPEHEKPLSCLILPENQGKKGDTGREEQDDLCLNTEKGSPTWGAPRTLLARDQTLRRR